MIKNFFLKILHQLLSLLFPIECLGCGQEDAYLCDRCFDSIKIHQNVEPFEHPLKYIDEIWTAADYSDKLVRLAIQNLKFRFIQELTKPLSDLLVQYYKNVSPGKVQNTRYEISARGGSALGGQDTRPVPSRAEGYMIIPVPLNKKRLLERGFNQAELIGKLFADYFEYPIISDVVERARHTPHQVGLNQEQRKTNIRNAFRVLKPDFIKNKNIILIDDVVTTGSTLEEIAKTLKESGAAKVFGLAVAKD